MAARTAYFKEVLSVYAYPQGSHSLIVPERKEILRATITDHIIRT